MKFVAWHFYNDAATASRGLWFRVFGVGLSIDNMPPMFSERYGFRRKLRIGQWGIEVLR